MALIKYTQFIGIRTAENGSNGFITNSTSYSMLIVYFDGTREIAEGDARAMRPFLPFLKEDNTAQILQESLSQLENKLESMVDTRIERIFAVRYPIPDVKGMREDEAVAKLEAAGFQVKMANTYPDGMPLGRVHSYSRENENYLTVVLDVRHELPDVVGMMETEAVAVLEKAGFTVKLTNGQSGDETMGTVFACTRKEETSVVAYLDVRLALPDVVGMLGTEAVAVLEKAGFTVKLTNGQPGDEPVGTVFACTRKEETGNLVYLDVRLALPEVTNMSEAEATAILTAAGFQVKPLYIDRLNLDYGVVGVDRPDPRKSDVVLKLASRQVSVTGMDLDAARRSLEAIGQRVTVERRRSSGVAAGIVTDWREKNGGICLYVSSGDEDAVASVANCRATLGDGAVVDCRKLSAVYSWKNKTLVLAMEVLVNSKNKYVMGTYCSASVDQKSMVNKVQASLGSDQIEGGTWVPFKFTINGLDYADQGPATAEVLLFSTYGMFKKEASWTLKFDLKW